MGTRLLDAPCKLEPATPLCLQAGVDGAKLPDKFLIQKTNGSEPPLGILLERDIDLESSLIDKRKVMP